LEDERERVDGRVEKHSFDLILLTLNKKRYEETIGACYYVLKMEF
jgi:hypothetical protein